MIPAAVVLMLIGPAPAADPPKFDPAADMQKFPGVWETDPAGKATARLEVNDDGFNFRFKGEGFDITMRNSSKPPFELKEVDGKTVIRVDETLAKISDMPQDITYRFDKEVLVLAVPSGKAKGEYRLTRAAKK
jgi:hypothetical protein